MLVINELYVLQKSPAHPILQRLPLATLQASIGVEQTKNCSSPPSISMAILLRSSSHRAVVFLSAVIALYPCSEIGITRFIDEIFRELLAYLKYFGEFCVKVVHTMV